MNRNVTKTNKKRTSNTGGKVVASGGYGCVFNPSLKCIDKSNRQDNYVSKLMLKRDAKSEYDDVTKFKNDLDKIPNYENYFLLNGFSLCEPDKLTDADLIDFDKKCKTLVRSDITKTNINKKLNELVSLNMPNGGVDLGDYIEQNGHSTYKEMIRINNSLIDLLVNGIIPMNKMGIYHQDVKESNILIDINNDKMYARLIDWGIGTKYDGSNKFPRHSENRPFQYNIPFSCILFNDKFDSLYKSFLKENPEPEDYSIRTFVIDYIFFWNTERGIGHMGVIENIFGKLFSMDLTNMTTEERAMVIELEYAYNSIIEYLTAILIKYTKNGEFDKMKYFKEVYIKIIDVWGLIISYEPILTKLFSNYINLNQNEMKLYNKIKYIFMKYLYEPRLEPINIDKLVSNLKSLNPLFEKADKNTSTTQVIKLLPESSSSSLSQIINIQPLTSSKNKNKTSTRKSSSSKTSKKNKSRKSSLTTLGLNIKTPTKKSNKDIIKTISTYLDENEEERTADIQ